MNAMCPSPRICFRGARELYIVYTSNLINIVDRAYTANCRKKLEPGENEVPQMRVAHGYRAEDETNSFRAAAFTRLSQCVSDRL